MKRRLGEGRPALLLLAAAAACASSETASPPQETPTQIPDASTDVDIVDDAGPDDGDAAPCTDCEWFPEECSADVLCPNALFTTNDRDAGFDPRTPVVAIRGRSRDDVWLSGSLGALAHFDGTSWKRSDPGSLETMFGLWLQGSTDIAIGAYETQFHFEQYVYVRGEPDIDGSSKPSLGGWMRAAAPLIDPYLGNMDMGGVWGAPGATWSWLAMVLYNANTPSSGLMRLRSTGPGTFELALGPESDCRPGCNQMRGVHGSSANDVWAVGSNGTTIRIAGADGDTPKATLYDSQTWNGLNGVWAASESEAWSVGGNGTIRHFAGELAWEVENVPTKVALNAVWGSSSTDVWAVGDEGVVLHSDGHTWSRQKIAGLGTRRPNLMSVWTGAPGHVWIGGKGVVLSLGGKP